jgi:hypothetical protein
MSQLFEAKNERQVLICLSALGRAVYTVPGYTGPALGRAAAAGTKGSPKHAVAGGGGLWGKSGGGYSAVGGGVQVEASSRGVKPASSSVGFELVEEGVPPAVDPSSMSGNCGDLTRLALLSFLSHALACSYMLSVCLTSSPSIIRGAGMLKKKKGVTPAWTDVNVAIKGDELIIDSTLAGGKGGMQIALGEMFDCQMLDSTKNEFEIVGPNSTLRFRADSKGEAQQWIDALSLRLAVAPSPLSRPEPTVEARGKTETAIMWGVQAELIEAAAGSRNVLETFSVAISPQTNKAEFLSAVADAMGTADTAAIDISSGRANFYMAKFREAADSAAIVDFMNDGAVFSCTKPSTAAHAPAPSPAPSTRTTAPSATHVGLQQGTTHSLCASI